MGLREKYAKKLEMQGFEPIDLNEEDVRVIFKKCLADENTTEKIRTYLFSSKLGYSVESEDHIYFDKNKIKENEKPIAYLYGQLYEWHHKSPKFKLAPKTAALKYTGETWTRNNRIIMEFLYLGRAINILTPFFKEDQAVTYIFTAPTLSPNDPKFSEWWKEHKPEWEGRRRGGLVFDY